MMARRGMMGVLAGAAAAVLGGCGMLFPNKYRFRMTVEVETPSGLRRSSAIFEVWANDKARLLPDEAARDWGVKGEALVIDLLDGPVFALLKTENPMRADLAQMSMAALDPEFHNDIVESAARIAGSWSTREREVTRADWPLMVRFRDIADPKSVERIDPEAIGVKRIVVETTSDDVTTGIEKHLRWLRNPKVMKTSWAQLPYEARAAIIHLSSSVGDEL